MHINIDPGGQRCSILCSNNVNYSDTELHNKCYSRGLGINLGGMGNWKIGHVYVQGCSMLSLPGTNRREIREIKLRWEWGNMILLPQTFHKNTHIAHLERRITKIGHNVFVGTIINTLKQHRDQFRNVLVFSKHVFLRQKQIYLQIRDCKNNLIDSDSRSSFLRDWSQSTSILNLRFSGIRKYDQASDTCLLRLFQRNSPESFYLEIDHSEISKVNKS